MKILYATKLTDEIKMQYATKLTKEMKICTQLNLHLCLRKKLIMIIMKFG